MAKPEVSISAPTTLFVGQPFVMEIDIKTDARHEINVEYIEATLTGDQGWAVGSGKSRVTQQVKFPKLVQRVMGAGVLPAGQTTRFTAQFVLPPGTAPTHALDPAWSKLKLRIHISIPWRIDGRYNYEFDVRVPPPEHVERTPFAIRSTPLTAAPDKPRIELGLASTRLIAGETLVGTCAVFHLDDREERDVELTLVPMLQLLGRGRARERRGASRGVTITLPPGSAGTGVPFELPIPKTLVPTFETVSHTLQWWLVARSGSFFGGKVDISVPLEIVDASAAATTAKLTSAPRLGDEQVATLFATFAARNGWQGAAEIPDEDEAIAGQFAIEREVGDAHLRIAYAYRGPEGTFLTARIGNPLLGLGLSVSPSSSLRHVFFKDVEVDISPWDRAHHVVARSPAQTIPVLRGIVPTLMKASRLGTLVRWNDDELVFERPVSVVDESDLEWMASNLAAVAMVVLAAQRTVMPPPGVTTDLVAWQELAVRLGGRLIVGDLSIDGTLDGVPVDIGLAWTEDHRPTSVHVTVGDPEAASAEVRSLAISLPHPAADVLGHGGAERLVDLVTRWPANIIDLRIFDGVASASYALPPGEAPVVDAVRVRELVTALRGVLVALEPSAGPYR